MKRFPIVAISVTMLTLVAPTRGDADHIGARITSGTILAGPGAEIAGSFAIAGPGAFTFNASYDSGNSEGACFPCRSGDTISLSTNISPAYFGTATYRGKSYPFHLDAGGGWFAIEAPSFTLPRSEGPTAEFQTPFTVSDTTYLFLQNPDGTGHNLRLSGSGTATARYRVQYDPDTDTYLYFFETIRFDFSKR